MQFSPYRTENTLLGLKSNQLSSYKTIISAYSEIHTKNYSRDECQIFSVKLGDIQQTSNKFKLKVEF